MPSVKFNPAFITARRQLFSNGSNSFVKKVVRNCEETGTPKVMFKVLHRLTNGYIHEGLFKGHKLDISAFSGTNYRELTHTPRFTHEFNTNVLSTPKEVFTQLRSLLKSKQV
jgi:hypothetical protein